MLACVGRGVTATHLPPSDNNGNAFKQLGAKHTYKLWPKSGTALYACERSVGSAGHIVTACKPLATDETTLSVVEVIQGGVVVDVKWREVLAGAPLTSPSVTTTGPALLVAWWWGDADSTGEKTAVPDSEFTLVDAILLEGSLVQCVVATRQVSMAGTFQLTWTATPLQGAQLWIAAVQSAA